MHNNHFPWKLLLNNFPSTTLNLAAYFFRFSFFNRLVGSTPSKRYLRYESCQSSSWSSPFNTSAWFEGIIEQVLQSLYSSLASLAISSQKTPNLYNLLYMPTSRFTPQILWCNLYNYVSLSYLETHFISKPFAPLKTSLHWFWGSLSYLMANLTQCPYLRSLPLIRVLTNLPGGTTRFWLTGTKS